MGMAMSAQQIVKMITGALPGARVNIDDLAGDNDHFSVTVESALFRGKTRVAQHKMVYDALQGGMGTALHALSIRTVTPETSQESL
jgi:stress-induced morphogen